MVQQLKQLTKERLVFKSVVVDKFAILKEGGL